MDLYAGHKAGKLGHEASQKKKPVPPQPVGNPVQPDSMQTRIAYQHLKSTTGGRITVKNRVDVITHLIEHETPLFSAGTVSGYHTGLFESTLAIHLFNLHIHETSTTLFDNISFFVKLPSHVPDARPNEIERIEFSDGTVWAAASIGAVLLTGTDGNDTIIGCRGNDLQDGFADNYLVEARRAR
jgi:hypothetical protein